MGLHLLVLCKYVEPIILVVFVDRYLGQLYMGEALVVLDRIADAIQHLNPDTVTDISTSLPDHKQETGTCRQAGYMGFPRILISVFPGSI